MSYQISAKKIELPIETKYLDFLYNIIKKENSDAIVSNFGKNLFIQYIEALLESKNINLYICELNGKSIGYAILSEKPSYLISNFKKLRVRILINLIINFKIKSLLNLFLIIFKIDLILLSSKKRKLIDGGHNLNLLAIDTDYQSKGIGRNFMKIVFESLSIISKLNHLTVEANNDKTGKFYEEKLGFTYLGKEIRFSTNQKIYIKNFI